MADDEQFSLYSAPVQQSPAKEVIAAPPATITVPITTATGGSPRTKVQRTRVHSYKLESEESGDDKVQIQAGSSHHVTAQQVQQQSQHTTTQKRTLQQRSVIPIQPSKRTKLSVTSVEALEAPEPTPQVQTVQIVKQVMEPDYVEIPIESINAKAEPEYADETGEIETVETEAEQEHTLTEHEQSADQEQADDDGNYVEDEYAEMGKFEESYFTEGEDAKAGASGFGDSYTSDGGTGTEQSAQDSLSMQFSKTADVLPSVTREVGNAGKHGTIRVRKELSENPSTRTKRIPSDSSSTGGGVVSWCKSEISNGPIDSKKDVEKKVQVPEQTGRSSSDRAVAQSNNNGSAVDFVAKGSTSRRRRVLSPKRNQTSLSSSSGKKVQSSFSAFGSPTTTTSLVVSTETVDPPELHDSGGVVKFIRSQKKCAQLVYDGYIYNRKIVQQNGRTTWRCSDLLKYRCNATCVTKLNQLVSIRREHHHENHLKKICTKSLFDYPEDLEEYLNIYTRDPIDASNQQVEVIDAGAEYKVVLRDNGGNRLTKEMMHQQEEEDHVEVEIEEEEEEEDDDDHVEHEQE
ncbi:Mod(mdg4)-v26 [Anopheles sinensis]|uniref:FLYWCH-type domain-containing protein n=1 Tax=Anopheles sinensis TaxID=74873 RepID=A0A084WSS9_ANOSI|nr:Mod(mdg4)-v26 [Anopheles sinensis]